MVATASSLDFESRLIPFLAAWILIWLPLSKARESMPDRTRIT
jgi:hypothetical protein